jgi:hypothetical protein
MRSAPSDAMFHFRFFLVVMAALYAISCSPDLAVGERRARDHIGDQQVFPINFEDRIFSSDASWLRWEDAKRSCRTSDIEWLQNDRADGFEPFEALSIFIENQSSDAIFYQYRDQASFESAFRFMQVPYATVQSRGEANISFVFADIGAASEGFGEGDAQIYAGPGCSIYISHDADAAQILTHVRAPHGAERAVCIVSTLMISIGFVGFGEAESWSATSFYGDEIQSQNDLPATTTVFYDQRVGIHTTNSLLCLGSLLSLYNRPHPTLEIMRSDFQHAIACAKAPDADSCISAIEFELPGR